MMVEAPPTSTLPAEIARPLGATSVPTDGRLPETLVGPFRVRVPPLLPMVPAMALLPAALSVTWSLFAPEAEIVTPLLTVMLLCAVKVSVASELGVVMIELATVMSPASLPPALVTIVTLMPLSSAVLIVLTVMMAESPVVEIVPGGEPVTLESGPVVWIRALFGSSSHWPPRPEGALASAGWDTSSMRLPEVST